MDLETSLGLLTVIVTIAALGIAAWAAWTAQQTLKHNAAPQLECFLRPRPSNTVFDFVIINAGSGSAYNVGWKIDADEQAATPNEELDQSPDGGGKGMAAFISIVKYLNNQPFPSSSLFSQAASSQASSAREPLNSLILPASRSAISLEPGS